MISKTISDLKDINFEISTALQFEPSQVRTLEGKSAPLPTSQQKSIVIH